MTGHKYLRGMAVLALIAAGALVNLRIDLLNRGFAAEDYNQFYSASRLVGTGYSYDWEALRPLEAENGGRLEGTGRLPIVLYGHKLLTVFPFPVARAIWMAVSVAAILAALFAWPGANRPLFAIALAWSTPLSLDVFLGQDIPFFLLFFSLALLWMERGKPRLAGVAFALCICKFQLALGIPILLIAQRRWNTLFAGAAAFAGLVGGCFLVDGTGWPQRYLQMVGMPDFSPAPERMPSLRGVAAFTPWPLGAEIFGGVALAVLLWLLCRKTSDLGMAGAVAAACGLLLAPHSLIGDCTLLVPLTVLIVQALGAPVPLKMWAAFLQTPAIALILVSLNPQAQLLIVGFVAAVIVWVKFARQSPLPVPVAADSAEV